MKYKFPEIKNIKDVMPYVDLNYFMLADRGDHTTVNYLFSSPDTFPDITDEASIMRREFRGLIFDAVTGDLVRRPYHKFFNVGERVDTKLDVIDVSKPHAILDKLDGSMIVPYKVNGRLIWGTKMGETDVSKQVLPFLEENPDYVRFAEQAIVEGYSPIFEWCSRKQRIVLDYKKDKLVLTAIRNMHTGNYLIPSDIASYVVGYDIEVVKSISGEKLSEKFIDQVRQISDVEGFVIRFDDGHMVKIKCDWYCQLHRVKSDIQYERGVVQLILDEKIDDLKSMMTDDDLNKINTYEKAFLATFGDNCYIVKQVISQVRKSWCDRKWFALNIAPYQPSWVTAITFKLWDALDDDLDNLVQEQLKSFYIKGCGRNSRFNELRSDRMLFTNVPEWNGVYLDGD